jgi:predicted O-linked N-acetylglucosamine transferase (SPINDLY family)
MVIQNLETAKQFFIEGLNFLESGRLEEAEARFLESLKFAPDRASILTNLSATQIKLKKFDLAKISAKKATDLDSSSAQAWLNLGVSELETLNQEQGILALKKTVELKKDSIDALLLLAQIYDLNNSPIEAIKYFKEILQFIPDHFDSLSNLGSILNDLSQFEEALQFHEDALQINPEHCQTLINSGIAFGGLKKYVTALSKFNKAVEIDAGNIDAWANICMIHYQLGQYEDALASADRVLSINPNVAALWANRCIVLNKLRRYDEALVSADRAISIDPNLAEAYYNQGNILKDLKRLNDARGSYERAIAINSDFINAHNNLGLVLKDLGHLDPAAECFNKIIAIDPNHVEAHINLGNVLQGLGQSDEALIEYQKATIINPCHAEAFSNKGNALRSLKRFEEALTHYDQAIRIKSNYAEAWSNKGVSLHELQRFDDAMTCYEKAISLNPNDAEAYSNKGNTLRELQQYDEAITNYDKALSLKSDYAEAWYNKGNILFELKQLNEALISYDKAASLKPNIDWIHGDLVSTGMSMCSWQDLNEILQNITNKLLNNQKVANPLPLLALLNDASLHKKCSEIFMQAKFPPHLALGPIPKYPKKEKIRLAYFSADFRNHPVAFLISELFEIHCRSSFEVFAFSLRKAPIEDEITLRLKNGFDHFINVENKSDQEIAQLARSLEIDIAIDLSGYTQYSRTGIFAYRAAPIQVNYLGYPGTMGAQYIDYIIADKTLIPQSHQQFYTEKVVTLPNSYQVNDRKRIISDRQFNKQELGLPERGFVFCCFNNNHKILPKTFDSWMRILKAVEGSVLWLLTDNPSVEPNLKKYAQQHGIDGTRLVFAERMPLSEHLARHALADLFIDTAPYNAHTTASDALWAGLPVLTLPGQSFASRVAASLLNAIGLPELITNSQEEYEALAIELAMSPQKLATIKLKLANNRLTTPLFDTPLFTKHIEAAYIKMYERYQADLMPDHITI